MSSFRTLLHLRSVALQPSFRVLKPLKPAAGNATVPSSTAAPYKLLLPRISYSSAYTSLVPAPCNFLGTGHGSFSAMKAKEPQPAKKGEEYMVVTAGGNYQGRRGTPAGSWSIVRRMRSKAYRIYGETYACVYVLSWMIGRLIFLAARDGLERLRRYVREKFNQKR